MSDTARRRIDWWRWLLVVGVTAAVAVPSLLPSAGVGSGVGVGLHVVAGAILVGGYGLAVADRPASGASIWWCVIAAGGVVVLLEGLQAGVPGRSPTVVDVLAGWGGVAVTALVWTVHGP